MTGWPEVRIIEPEEGIALSSLALIALIGAEALLLLDSPFWVVAMAVAGVLTPFLVWDVVRGRHPRQTLYGRGGP